MAYTGIVHTSQWIAPCFFPPFFGRREEKKMYWLKAVICIWYCIVKYLRDQRLGLARSEWLINVNSILFSFRILAYAYEFVYRFFSFFLLGIFTFPIHIYVYLQLIVYLFTMLIRFALFLFFSWPSHYHLLYICHPLFSYICIRIK